MEKTLVNKFIHLLNEIIDSKNNKIKLINNFQDLIWDIKDESIEYAILNELAYDLDFYEIDINKRKEDSSYFGDDKLKQEIEDAIHRILLNSMKL